MKAFATGGIVDKPVIGLVGEAGREAIIPLEHQSTGAALWLKAGEELGLVNQAEARAIDFVNAPTLESRAESLNAIRSPEYVTNNSANNATNNTSTVINPVFNITFSKSPENQDDFMSMFRTAWEMFQEQEMRVAFV